MGWSSGTRLACALIESIATKVEDDETRHLIYLDLIECFTDQDWDCVDEAFGIDDVFDHAALELGWGCDDIE